MIKNKKGNGLFIAFEGLDGSGSSTQANLLLNYLKNKGRKAFLTKEPTNNIIGGLIRGQLTGDWKTSMECLQLLFAADRAHHFDREIKPALAKGKIIITDRYLFSSIAYGSLALDESWLWEINKNFAMPNCTFLLNVPPGVCLKRITESRLGLELFEEKKKLYKVWSAYERLAKKFKNVFIIDGLRSPEEIHLEISGIVDSFLNH
ncbi:MAG: dTMP kinase [Patescibacteria group bacterium]|nr:dTMP kinase [Patescibacteria group bacterium]